MPFLVSRSSFLISKILVKKLNNTLVIIILYLIFIFIDFVCCWVIGIGLEASLFVNQGLQHQLSQLVSSPLTQTEHQYNVSIWPHSERDQ